MIFGKGLTTGHLSESEVGAVAAEGLAALPVDGRSVLVLIPDSTRTMPMPLLYDILERELGPRVTALDYLVALGTHAPMSDEALSRHIGRAVSNGYDGKRRIFNHRWDDPATFITLGTIPATEIERLTNGICRQPVSVTLNRLILEYDHILICGPVFPHEVAGFSGGAKYFFPGIAGAEIIDFTHWLGALVTNFEIIGTRDTVVRAVIHKAVEMIDRPHALLAPVVTHEGVAGIFCGPTVETWQAAAALSDARHVIRVDKPLGRVLAVLPSMYTDLWTGAKGMYKVERAVADGGEVVLYAPHISEVSHVHGQLINEIGYHCRDYFLGQWDRFRDYPGGVLAHSTHLRGLGTWDGECKVETLRIQVTLATAVPEAQCRKLNLGYMNPADVKVEDGGWFVIPNAGETLYCLNTIAPTADNVQ